MQGDIGDNALLDRLLAEHRPRAIVNFAAESHVDRSIHGPEDFVVAPGGGGYAFDLGIMDFVVSTGDNGSYYGSSGTSMAAPHVSGVSSPQAIRRSSRERPAASASWIQRGRRPRPDQVCSGLSGLR